MYASQWFLTLFTAKFPLCMVFHITDLLLCEVKSLHCVILIALGEDFSPHCPVRGGSTIWKHEIS